MEDEHRMDEDLRREHIRGGFRFFRSFEEQQRELVRNGRQETSRVSPTRELVESHHQMNRRQRSQASRFRGEGSSGVQRDDPTTSAALTTTPHKASLRPGVVAMEPVVPRGYLSIPVPDGFPLPHGFSVVVPNLPPPGYPHLDRSQYLAQYSEILRLHFMMSQLPQQLPEPSRNARSSSAPPRMTSSEKPVEEELNRLWKDLSKGTKEVLKQKLTTTNSSSDAESANREDARRLLDSLESRSESPHSEAASESTETASRLHIDTDSEEEPLEFSEAVEEEERKPIARLRPMSPVNAAPVESGRLKVKKEPSSRAPSPDPTTDGFHLKVKREPSSRPPSPEPTPAETHGYDHEATRETSSSAPVNESSDSQGTRLKVKREPITESSTESPTADLPDVAEEVTVTTTATSPPDDEPHGWDEPFFDEHRVQTYPPLMGEAFLHGRPPATAFYVPPPEYVGIPYPPPALGQPLPPGAREPIVRMLPIRFEGSPSPRRLLITVPRRIPGSTREKRPKENRTSTQAKEPAERSETPKELEEYGPELPPDYGDVEVLSARLVRKRRRSRSTSSSDSSRQTWPYGKKRRSSSSSSSSSTERQKKKKSVKKSKKEKKSKKILKKDKKRRCSSSSRSPSPIAKKRKKN